MATISASAARQTFTTQLDRVQSGEEVAITRHGHVVAVLVRPDVLAARRAQKAWDAAERVAARLSEARKSPMPDAAIDAVRADELVESIRADRAGR